MSRSGCIQGKGTKKHGADTVLKQKSPSNEGRGFSFLFDHKGRMGGYLTMTFLPLIT